MATINPQQLLAAAMQSQGSAATGAPTDQVPTGAPSDALPASSAPAGPTGASPGATGSGSTGSMTNTQLSGLVGQGSEMGQDPGAIQQMVAMLQDPSTPPDQRQQIQMRLQLAALGSLAGGPQGAAGSGAQG